MIIHIIVVSLHQFKRNGKMQRLVYIIMLIVLTIQGTRAQESDSIAYSLTLPEGGGTL